MIYFKKMQTIFQKRLLEKKKELFEKIRESYGENLLALVLFGSAARGDLAAYSDIDLLVVLKESPLSLRKRLEEFYERVGYYFGNHFLSPLVLKLSELEKFHPFYLGIFENYITLYDKNGIIEKTVKEIKEKIKRGEIIEKNFPLKHWRIASATT